MTSMKTDELVTNGNESDEITLDMEDAGVDAFFRIDYVDDSPQEIVREIYQAMSRQAQAHPPG